MQCGGRSLHFQLIIIITSMGNQITCCEGTPRQEESLPIYNIRKNLLTHVPAPIKKVYSQKNPFREKINANGDIITIGSNYYQGDCNRKGLPHGWGRMFDSNHCLYTGHFREGKFDGEGFYIFADGSYLDGDFVSDQMEGEGEFNSKNLQYKGGFKESLFDGRGEERGPGYSFNGNYQSGVRTEGTLSWIEQGRSYEYTGKLDAENKFVGEGILIEPFGQYNGSFENGLKHGSGTYKFQNGQKYVGEYREGKREGKGVIYNSDGSISYEGEWMNGLPNGKGVMHNKRGLVIESQFLDGIDSRFISNECKNQLTNMNNSQLDSGEERSGGRAIKN